MKKQLAVIMLITYSFAQVSVSSINDIANKMGGGGHAYAAGALVNGTLSEVTSKAVDLTITSVERKMKGN